jgi:predicted AAA+ superfamily ATPase
MFIDPSIAVASLKLSPATLTQDLHTFGFIFENLCIRDLKVYSSALGGTISYYRDRFGLEADAVLHLNDGRYALIEFKLGSRDIEDAALHLIKLQQLIIRSNNEKKSSNLREPDLLIIITGGEMAYTRKDGVKIVPIGCLKD